MLPHASFFKLYITSSKCISLSLAYPPLWGEQIKFLQFNNFLVHGNPLELPLEGYLYQTSKAAPAILFFKAPIKACSLTISALEMLIIYPSFLTLLKRNLSNKFFVL